MRGEAWLVLAALVAEACIGYPQWLYARIRHPVTWLGALLAVLESRWNVATTSDVRRRALGIVAVALIVALSALIAVAIERVAANSAIATACLVLLATSGLAQRSLYEHVRAVQRALDAHDLPAARRAVGHIVGRDTAQLDERQVTAAALESLAESCNDAVIAPAFWLLVGGLPGLLAYKAVNTADSMIGHMEPRWRMFGWAAARCDDVLNWVPARIAGALLTLAARRGFSIMLRDASKHASPNAGWPEAALAGGLAIRLGGPTSYDGLTHERPTFGDGDAPTHTDLGRGLLIYMRACGLLWVALITLGLVTW